MGKKRNVEYKITADLTIIQKLDAQIIDGKAAGVYKYYIGKKFIFGVLEPFDITDLNALYLNGYFDQYL